MSKVPINMRAEEDLRNLIDQAASIVNKDRTNFILDTMRREAEDIIFDQRIFKVDQHVFEQLDAMLESPMSQNIKLTALLKSKSPWE